MNHKIAVWVLGADGMLGRQVATHLHEKGFRVIGTVRTGSLPAKRRGFETRAFEVEKFISDEHSLELIEGDVVINCIGVVKSRIENGGPDAQRLAIVVNSLFPHKLAAFAIVSKARVIQIATDCVYSGLVGNYSEVSQHDTLDVYGKSKSLGEVNSTSFLNLRCSIIGPEIQNFTSLMEWVRRQPRNSKINGYVNHLWNGITTRAFAQIVEGLLQNNFLQAGTWHVTPADSVSKFELIKLILEKFGRHDMTLNPVETKVGINRTLVSSDKDMNFKLWNLAGYENPPTIQQLVKEMEA